MLVEMMKDCNPGKTKVSIVGMMVEPDTGFQFGLAEHVPGVLYKHACSGIGE